ncbi:MAG TPA: hypothetical protein VLK29_12885 [Luteimonas sp.]|nr:hypothetical protein [Luteimonas sp.]
MIEHDDTLTPDEAELSAALSRLRTEDAPPAGLDAAILASARRAVDAAGRSAPPGDAATAAPPTRPPSPHAHRRRPRARMAAGLGIAASVLLAAGLAWQLRPVPGDDIRWSEAPMAAVGRDDAEAKGAAGAVPESAQRAGDTRAAQARVVPAPAPDPARDEPAADGRARTADAPATAPLAEATAEPDAAGDEVEANGARASDARSERPMPAPAPPPAPASMQDAPAPQTTPAASGRAPLAAPVAAEVPAAPRDAPQPGVRAAAAADALRDESRRARSKAMARDAAPSHAGADGAFDQPFDDQPPASVDSPDVRRAWLVRITELLEDEQYDAARASLAEFRRRYPDDAVPAELAPLQE